MTSALVGIVQGKVAKVTVRTNGHAGTSHLGRNGIYLSLRNRMLYNNYCVVYVPALDKVVGKEEFYLMEEYEGTAGCNLFCVIDRTVEGSLLDAQDP